MVMNRDVAVDVRCVMEWSWMVHRLMLMLMLMLMLLFLFVLMLWRCCMMVIWVAVILLFMPPLSIDVDV